MTTHTSTGDEEGEEKNRHRVECFVGQSVPFRVSFCGNLLRSSGLWDSRTDAPQFGIIAMLSPHHTYPSRESLCSRVKYFCKTSKPRQTRARLGNVELPRAVDR